jgi:hypothetical protein
MDADAVRKLIQEKQHNGSISCKAAMEIAEQAGLPPIQIGKMLNEMKIKIRGCQLGCFS